MRLSSPKKLNKTLRKNWILEQPLDFTGCSSIQFFNLLPSLIHPVPLIQLVRLPGITHHLLCSACVTYKTLCHAIGHRVLPTQPLLSEVEDFPRGGKYFNHVSLVT